MDALDKAGFDFHLALEALPDDEMRDVALVIEKSFHGAQAASLQALRETLKAEFARRVHMAVEEPSYTFRGSHDELAAGRLFADALASLTLEKSPATARLWQSLGRLLAVTASVFYCERNLPGSVN